MKHVISLTSFLILVLLITFQAGYAQQQNNRVISGIVKDPDGNPMPGVQIVIENTNNGTISSENGRFSITSAVSEPTLVFSFIGFSTKKVTVKNSQQTLSIQMEESAIELDEVVAIGYGTQSRKTLTSAVSIIKADDIADYAGSSIEQSIAGLVPGVRIQTMDATPGGDMNVQIRGVGSVNSGTEPLYIIDGIPMEGGLASINPQDVKDIQFLKDAASTAVYGSRGANGVILVTTKRGTIGKPKVEFNTKMTVSQVQRKFEVMNSEQMIDYLSDFGSHERYKWATNLTQDYFPFSADINTDWQDEIFRNAPRLQYNLAVSGGTKDVSYRVSGEILDQQGVVIETGMKRYTFRSNLDVNLAKWLKMKINMSHSSTNTRKTREGGHGENGVIRTAINMYPFFPVYLPNGEYFSLIEYNMAPSNESLNAGINPVTGKFDNGLIFNSAISTIMDNPVAIAHEYQNITSVNRTNGGIDFEAQIIRGLTFNTTLYMDTWSNNRRIWYPPSIGKNNPGNASETSRRYSMLMNENVLTYNKKKEEHNLSLVAGNTIQQAVTRSLQASANQFSTEGIPSINSGIVNGGWYNEVDDRLLSYFIRGTYDYEQKYMLQAVYRIDGSSRFGKNNRFGHFPSVSAGWSIREEDFMRPLRRLISELKIRTSWGVSGNNAIGQYNQYNRLSQGRYVIDGNIVSGWAPNNIGNPDLKWEKSTQTNIGLDFGLLRNRIFMQVDLYNSKTTDMLLNSIVPSSLGVSRMLRNVGSVRNRGLEFNITSRNLIGKFRWTTAFNISGNRNKVLSLGTDSEVIYGGMGETAITKVGYPMGMFYGLVFDGLYASQEEITALRNDINSGLAYDDNVRPGDFKLYDLNGDGYCDDQDKAIIGNPHPLFTAGMTNTFNYKNFTFSFQLNGQYGNMVYNHSLHALLRGTDTNMSVLAIDRWKSEAEPGNSRIGRLNKLGEAAPIVDANKFSARFLEDGSYLTIRNIRFSYAVPKRLLTQYFIQSLAINLNVDNLYTFTKYTGLNPEASLFNNPTAPGIDRTGYPLSRNYSLGINISF